MTATTEAWLPDLAREPGPKYRAIADALGRAIDAGRLGAGERLPSQRILAERLGVDLTTVTKAYDMARHRGLIDTRGRAGSFVTAHGSETAAEPPHRDMGMNTPPDLPGGMLSAALTRSIGVLLAPGGAARLHYQPPGGAPQDRAAGAAWLASLGAPADEAQVVMTAGGQNALHAILATALAPGDAIACGRFVYPGLKALAARLGLTLVPLAELSAAALEAAAVKALYLVPTNDNPTAHTVMLEERRAIAAVAERRGLIVIEDDAYSALSSTPIPPLGALAPGRCWHIASLSKIVSPALRVGWVRAPDIGAALRLAARVHETAVMPPPLNAAISCAWIADGTLARLVAAMRVEAEARQALAAEMLGGIAYQSHPQGYHLWLDLPDGLRAADLAEAMTGSGLSVVPGERFAVRPETHQAARISLGGPIDRARLTRALGLLRAHLSTRAPLPLV